MSINLTDCPFCPETFQTPEERDTHASEHSSTRKTINMDLDGIRISVTVVDPEHGIYACPGPCSTRSSLGGVYLHITQEHPTMFTNLKRKRDEDDLPSSLQTPSSLPPLFSTTYVGHSAAHNGSHGSNHQTYQYTPTNTSAAFPVVKILRVKPPLFTYNFAAATSQHPSMNDLLDFVGTSLSNLVDGCAFHGIMNHDTPSSHRKVYRCSEPRIAEHGSEYKSTFTKALHGRRHAVCFRCWCPMLPSFENHPDEVCNKGTNHSNRNHWEDWFRVLPYLIFRVKGLRDLVFQELGINGTVFHSNILSYAAWVTLPAGTDDERVTNLIILTATYLSLRITGKISPPGGGFELDVYSIAFDSYETLLLA
ncbi:hypothetical protein F5890DRAFT_1478318 [Lentinula detonsa]|uniref:C2H2-type domain-containing protein n=1 Tax=Lentinula detonsa TaxID=2804962 RepID=A0AA38UMP8_9AGAR|nr:hypothetical protein F5890DRAFT_1478318 [Lentinula detonsa]